MKRQLLLGAALVLLWSAPVAPAVLLLNDSFNYPDGPLVTVSTNLWMHHSGTTTGQVQVVSGQVFLSQANTEDVSRYLDGQPYPATTNIYLYSSFVINFASLPSSSGDYFAHFKTSSTSGFADKIFATTSGAPSGFFRIGLANSASSFSVQLTSNLSTNTDYVLVTRYAPSNASSTIWLNPSVETDPSVSASDTGTTITVTTYAFRETTGIGSFYVDNLLVGTSFGDVVPTVPPSITAQPQSQEVTEGATVTFTVGATGSSPLSYQWYFNQTNSLGDETNATLILTSVTTNRTGLYTVTVTNAVGSTNSDPATLTVNPAPPPTPPTIITQPQSQQVAEGADATFTVVAAGSDPLAYQWQLYGTNLADATLSALTLSSVTTNQAGSYTVVITNSAGSTNSQPASLTVLPASSQPLVSFSVLTYNVHGNGVGDWSTNTAQAQAIGRQLMYLQPDIITFNEIPYTNTWQMTNWITAFLPGYNLATNSGTDGFIRSVIASRFPITRSQKWLDGVSLRPFGYSGNFTRDLFEAQIAVPDFAQPLHVFTTHLKATTDSPQDDADKRAAEASAVSNFFFTVYLPTNASQPYVLTGDMNEDIFWPDNTYTSSLPIQRLTSPPTGLLLTTPENPITQTDLTESIQAKLTVRFDYILPCSLLFSNVLSSQVFRTDLLTNPVPPPSQLLLNDDKTASDHLPVMMEFGNPYAFRLTSIGWNYPAATLQWGSLSGGVYRVDYKTNLADLNWTTFNTDITAQASSLSWTDATATARQRFYRVRQLR